MALSQLQKRKHSVLSLAKIKTKFSKNFSFAVKFGIFGKSNSQRCGIYCYESASEIWFKDFSLVVVYFLQYYGVPSVKLSSQCLQNWTMLLWET